MSANDDEQLRRCAEALGDAVEQALPEWTVRHVERLTLAWSGRIDPQLVDRAHLEGGHIRDRLMPELRALLATDVDDQRSNPLAIVRQAVVAPTTILRDAGVPPVERDVAAAHQFPEDDYDLTPASFGELGPVVHEHGLAWGAAKAYVILHRRRAEGRR